jgi:signal peptide peptidase SppA
MNLDALTVPLFARLSDYVGLWAVEPFAFAALHQLAAGLDWRTHKPEPLVSALEKVAGPNGKSIAVVKMSGLLMKSQSSLGGSSTIQMRRDIRQAANDPDVAGILLAIDSPGGSVAGTDDLAAEVRAARRMKPVYAHIDDLGASAAYWVASQADRVTANGPTALVGSIGTLQVVHDVSEAAAKEGVRTLVFRTGPLKGLGTPGEKVTDEQIAHLQQLVNGVQQSFDAAVQQGRHLTPEQLAAVRHGGVMRAGDALKARLIDAVQPLSRTMAQLADVAKAGHRAGGSVEHIEPLAIDEPEPPASPAKPPEPNAQEIDKQNSVGSFPMLALGGLPTLGATEQTL